MSAHEQARVTPLCACGCGESVLWRHGRFNRFVVGHSGRVTSRKHGHAAGSFVKQSKTYTSWNAMRLRCFHPSNSSYPRYGGAGISVCARWLGEGGFERFLLDMGERPDETSLDRIDAAADYTPENCRWASIHEQNRTTRKFSPDEIRAIRDDTRYQRVIAAEHGVVQSTIGAIKRGERYSWVS